MFDKLFERFPNHHERDCLQHLRQASVPGSIVRKAVEAGLRPAAILRLVVRHGLAGFAVMEELLDELDAARRGRAS